MLSSKKYCIIGLGFIYPRHVDAIERNNGKVILTCDIDETKCPDYTDWVKMFNSPEFEAVDIVVICTPNYLHGPIAREAILRGKQVLTEKPMTFGTTQGLDKIYTVLQLRNSDKVKLLKEKSPKKVSVTAKMFREDKYWKGWKGDDLKSGGILYNLGVHYIDLLIFILGHPLKILDTTYSTTLATGKIEFEKGVGTYHIEILDNREGQIRKILADGEEVSLSDKDNLSYEDLHYEVHKALLDGKGVPYSEAIKSLNLIDQLK